MLLWFSLLASHSPWAICSQAPLRWAAISFSYGTHLNAWRLPIRWYLFLSRFSPSMRTQVTLNLRCHPRGGKAEYTLILLPAVVGRPFFSACRFSWKSTRMKGLWSSKQMTLACEQSQLSYSQPCTLCSASRPLTARCSAWVQSGRWKERLDYAHRIPPHYRTPAKDEKFKWLELYFPNSHILQ